MTNSLGPLDLLRLALRHRRLLIVAPALAGAFVVALGLLGDRSWTANASIVAQSPGGSVSRLAGLAAQFGMQMPTSGGGQSPEFFADVLRSDGMIRRLLATPYALPSGDSIDLAQSLIPGEENAARRAELALRDMRNRITASVGLKSGIIRVSAKLGDPELARQVVERSIAELNALNIASEQAMASQERRFTDDRLELARRELRTAEDRLEQFLRSNRIFNGAPALVLEEERLRRAVNLRQQVVVGLAQALEQARLEEVRNVPVISVVEAPVRPALPDSRKLVLKALFAAFSVGALAIGILLVGEWRRRFAASNPMDAAEVDRLTQEAAADIKRPWRLLSRNADQMRDAA
jgi:uncharacterized protein involved in exopolysaccharide biosynthesis